MAARDRLLETAGRLFYEHGITATGVDTLVAEARVSKPTLYAHFGSKDSLVTAVLEQRHARRRAELEAWVAQHGRTADAVLDWLDAFYARDGARGCAFLNAAAEGAAPDVVRAEKRWLRAFLIDLTGDERRGSQLLLLVDGISGRAVVEGRQAARAAIADARALLR